MRALALVLGLVVGGFGCVPKNEAQDSRTTWLSNCDQDSDCDSQLACVCGVCTLRCEQSACDMNSDAVCRPSANVVSDCSGAKICTQRCESSEECPFELECRSGQCGKPSDAAREPIDAAMRSVDARAVDPTPPNADASADSVDSLPPPLLDASVATAPTTQQPPSDPLLDTDQEPPDGADTTTDTSVPELPEVDAGGDPGTTDDTDEVVPLTIDCGFYDPAPLTAIAPDSCGGGCTESLGLCDELGEDIVVDRFFHATIALELRAKALLAAAEYWIAQSVQVWTGQELTADAARSQIETLLADGVPGMVIGPIELVYEQADCGVNTSDFIALVAACDADVDPGQQFAECQGTCTSNATDRVSCGAESTLTCTDPVAQCEGSCTGACLASAATKCEGICEGVCTVQAQADCAGTCTVIDDDPSGGCVCELAPGAKCGGECAGNCMLVEGTCDGECAGMCTYQPPGGGCTTSVRCEGVGDCAGQCDGELSLQTMAECEASSAALAVARAFCNPTAAQTVPYQLDIEYDPRAVQTALECFTVAYRNARDVQVLGMRSLDAAQSMKAALAVISARLDESDSAQTACAVSLLPDAAQRIDAAIANLQRSINLYY